VVQGMQTSLAETLPQSISPNNQRMPIPLLG